MSEHVCACEEKYKEIEQMIRDSKGDRSALIPVLQKTQRLFGYVPREIQVKVAEGLGIPLTDVYGTVTFYSFFSLKPKGKYNIQCCNGTACYVRGAPKVIERFEKELGIKAGDTTDDGKYSLQVVRCLGACGLSPTIMVNQDTHARMKADKVPEILKKYR